MTKPKLYTAKEVMETIQWALMAKKSEWVGLTHEDIGDAMRSIGMMGHVNDGRVKFAQAIEAVLKEKNT